MAKYRPSRESSNARWRNAEQETQRRGRQLLRKQIEREKKKKVTEKKAEETTKEESHATAE